MNKSKINFQKGDGKIVKTINVETDKFYTLIVCNDDYLTICDEIKNNSDIDNIYNLTLEKSNEDERLDFVELVDIVDITNTFLSVEQPIEILDEEVPAVYGLEPVLWSDWKVYYPSLDNTKVILVLATKVGSKSYNYSKVSKEENETHITYFGKGNIITKGLFGKLLKSEEYTPVIEE